MSSIQAYKAHKQEGTPVSKVHKQGLSAHLPKHPYISGCMILVGYSNQFNASLDYNKLKYCLVVRNAVQPLM